MADFDFEEIQTGQVVWPKRGRKSQPLSDKLIAVLQQSAMNDTTPYLVMPNEHVVSFGNLLNRAGTQLNLRIERNVLPDTPTPGMSTYNFRARGKRNRNL